MGKHKITLWEIGHNKKFEKYEDFEYPTGPDVVEVEGYTAKSIHEIAGDRLNPLGVYNYMIYLRENPEAAKAALDKRLVVR